MTVAVLAGFAVALLAPIVYRIAGRWTGWVLAAFPAALFVYFALQAPAVVDGEVIRTGIAWAPSINLGLTFRLDGLSLLFAFLVTGIGAGVLIYAGDYLAGKDGLGAFYFYLTLFMASMLGLVLADNLIVLFVFWELTTYSSFALIGFEHEKADARASAQQALLVTGLGGLAMLAGFIMLAIIADGAWDLSTLITRGEVIRDHALYLPALILVLLGAFTKSAQFPFHFWLPGAMAAPTPISAYLHSATMVKAGVYLLARMFPALGGSDAWLYTVTTVGAITMVLGAVLAVRETDLKRILAYTTVSALGSLTMLTGIGAPAAMKAFGVLLLAHALYKGALFMAAGAVDHATGTRDITRLGGLARALPFTAFAAGVGAVSMAGLPPLFGFVAKETLIAAVREVPDIAVIATIATITGAVFTVVASGLVAIRPFLGRPSAPETLEHAYRHPETLGLWLAPVALGLIGLVAALAPGTSGRWLIQPAASAARGEDVVVDLHLVPEGFDAVLALSIVAIALGVLGYLWRARLRGALDAVAERSPVGGERAYLAALAGLDWVSRRQTLILQSGYLRVYLMMMLFGVAALVSVPLAGELGLARQVTLSDVRAHEVGLAAFVIASGVLAAITRSPLTAVVALGLVGYGVALLWVLFGAPDLGLTQLLVETLTVLLLLFVFYHLPPVQRTPPGSRVRDLGISLGAGGLMTALLLAVAATPTQTPMRDFYVQHSYPLAHGRNIVNTILVDFRALDTFGEITVIAVSAVGVIALLGLLRRRTVQR